MGGRSMWCQWERWRSRGRKISSVNHVSLRGHMEWIDGARLFFRKMNDSMGRHTRKICYRFTNRRMIGYSDTKIGTFNKMEQAPTPIRELNHGVQTISNSSFRKKSGVPTLRSWTHWIIPFGIAYQNNQWFTTRDWESSGEDRCQLRAGSDRLFSTKSVFGGKAQWWTNYKWT